MTTRELTPIMGSLCEYLRQLTEEILNYRVRIKDFTPINAAFFAAGTLFGQTVFFEREAVDSHRSF